MVEWKRKGSVICNQHESAGVGEKRTRPETSGPPGPPPTKRGPGEGGGNGQAAGERVFSPTLPSYIWDTNERNDTNQRSKHK